MRGLLHYHPAIVALICYYVVSAAIGAMPAPTKDSKPFYVWLFRFANTLGANLARAYSTMVEKSPNFDAAVQDALRVAGHTPQSGD